MAPFTQHSVVADASTMIKIDSGPTGFLVGRPRCSEIWAVYGCLDRSVTSCREKKFPWRRKGCHSSWSMDSNDSLDSQHIGVFINPVKSIVFVKHGEKKPRQQAIQSMYGFGSTGRDGMSGDTKVQQMLVDMVKIQVGKARMTELVDERSQHLRNIADEAAFEFDRIAFRTMKGFDASGSRVLRQFDEDALAIEKDLMIARAELEAQSRDFEEFQVHIAYTRNEGLFFKNLYKDPRSLRYSSLSKNKMEGKILVVATTSAKDFSSSYRQLLYGGLSLVMVSFIWSSSSAFLAGTCMRASKLASYGIVFSLLLAQLACVKIITGEAENLEQSDK